MLKRDTRVQVFIVENGKYILLKHHDIKNNLYFWGIPGGGREEGETDEEAALREVYEETGLKVKLLPIKIEGVPQIKTSMYNRVVTFLAYPTEGEAIIGCEPEPELQQYYELVDIKWKEFFDNSNLESITYNDIVPFRNIINSDKFIKIKKYIVCKKAGESFSYLLFCNENSNKYELPCENNGFELKNIGSFDEKKIQNYGFFLSDEKEKLYKIDIKFIKVSDGGEYNGEYRGKWFKHEEIGKIDLDRICRNVIKYKKK